MTFEPSRHPDPRLWVAPTGTWSIALHGFDPAEQNEEGDLATDETYFAWLSTGHPTADAAYAAYAAVHRDDTVAAITFEPPHQNDWIETFEKLAATHTPHACRGCGRP